MDIDILRYSLFGIAGGQEVDRNFSLSRKDLYRDEFLFCLNFVQTMSKLIKF